MLNVPKCHYATGFYRRSDFSKLFKHVSVKIHTTQFQSISHDFFDMNSTPCNHAKLMKKSCQDFGFLR